MSDKARAELAPTGVLRAGINLSNFLLVTGRSEKSEPVGVAPDMAKEIAASLGVPVTYVPFKSPGELADQAGKNVWDIGLIGAEPYISGTAKLLSKLEPGPLPNIRLYEDDARDIIDALPDASIGRFFLLFPDPWPKTRHHKRRFLQSAMLDQLARILKPSAELRFASDDAGYLAYALERLMAHPAFAWTAAGPSDWRMRTQDWPPTRYEAKQLHGPPAFLRFVRTDRMAP